MAKKSEQANEKAAKLQVFDSLEQLQACEPKAETKGGNSIEWRAFRIGKAYVLATSQTDAVRRAYLAGALEVEVTEVRRANPKEVLAMLEALPPALRADVMKAAKQIK